MSYKQDISVGFFSVGLEDYHHPLYTNIVLVPRFSFFRGGRLLFPKGGWSCFHPATVSVNVYFRLTHVFSFGMLLSDTIVLVYIKAADCTLGC